MFMNDLLICYKNKYQVLFSIVHLEVCIIIEIDLRKILISLFWLFYRRHFENGLGEAMCHQI